MTAPCKHLQPCIMDPQWRIQRGGRSRRGPPPVQGPKNNNNNMLQNASFEALVFKIFQGMLPPDPSRAYKNKYENKFLKKIGAPPPRLSIPGTATDPLSCAVSVIHSDTNLTKISMSSSITVDGN